MNPLQVAKNRTVRLVAEARQESLAYSTTSGDPVNNSFVEKREQFAQWESNPYCFVCSRVTDHVGEHEGLVEAGMAFYADGGMVHKTGAYSQERAKEIAQAEYEAYIQNWK